jgi:hypothetical protein
MERDDVWRAIDQQRRSLVALLEDLSDQEWHRPSLCEAGMPSRWGDRWSRTGTSPSAPPGCSRCPAPVPPPSGRRMTPALP